MAEPANGEPVFALLLASIDPEGLDRARVLVAIEQVLPWAH